MTIYEQRLRGVMHVVLRYLPSDGLTAHEAMSEIIKLVDPWPVERPAKHGAFDEYGEWKDRP